MDQKNLISKAAMALKNKQYTLAQAEFEDILKHDVECLEAWFNLGNIFHLKGQLGKAVNAFQKVIALEPNHTDASISLSVILNDIGRYEEARRYFEQANQNVTKSKGDGVFETSINKKFSNKHFELAELYFSYNRFDEALFEYTKALRLNPENLEINIRIAKLYAKQGMNQKAQEELKSIKRKEPSYLPARIALGLLHYSSGKIIEAQTEWNSVLGFEAQHQEAQMYLKLSNSATEISL